MLTSLRVREECRQLVLHIPLGVRQLLQIGEVSLVDLIVKLEFFTLTQQETCAAPEVIMGILSILGREAHILIDLGSIHSFISHTFAMHIGREPKLQDCGLVVRTPTRESLLAESVYRDYMIGMGEDEFEANLTSMIFWAWIRLNLIMLL